MNLMELLVLDGYEKGIDACSHFGKAEFGVGDPLPLQSIEIMELAENLEIIYGAQ